MKREFLTHSHWHGKSLRFVGIWALDCDLECLCNITGFGLFLVASVFECTVMGWIPLGLVLHHHSQPLFDASFFTAEG